MKEIFYSKNKEAEKKNKTIHLIRKKLFFEKSTAATEKKQKING